MVACHATRCHVTDPGSSGGGLGGGGDGGGIQGGGGAEGTIGGAAGRVDIGAKDRLPVKDHAKILENIAVIMIPDIVYL